MASLDPHPVAGYDPCLRINLRERGEGGHPRGAVEALWRNGNLLPQRELLVLVHGYNNNLREAESAYADLRIRQQALLPKALQTILDDALGDVFWPGDADWGVVDMLDFLFYAGAVPVAKQVAPTIANYLRARTDVLTVHFLAHSLGCRVALEVIADIARQGGPRVGKVCLMAAAVPTFRVCPGGDLGDALTTAAQVRVLYSPDDIVLSTAFPPGQTLAGDGFFPSAVGHAGDIAQSGAVDRSHIVGASHGDYWGHADNPASRQSARAVFDFFRFDSLGERTLDQRPLPPARPDPPNRNLATRPIGHP